MPQSKEGGMTSQIQVGKPGLLRQLGFFSATALVISNMVGTGIFATTGFMAGDPATRC
jgi:amino acid transporter